MNEQALDYKMQGFAMMGVEKFDKAVELFSKSIEIEQNSDVYMDLGNAYASMGEYDNAVDAFSKALLLDPNNGEILFDIGCVYLLQERLKKCIEYYNKAEAAGYDNVRLYMNMAAIYNALEDKANTREVVELMSSNGETSEAVGILLVQLLLKN